MWLTASWSRIKLQTGNKNETWRAWFVMSKMTKISFKNSQPQIVFEVLGIWPPRLFLCPPAASVRRWHKSVGVVRTCVCLYVHLSVDQVKIFVQGRISRPINGSKLRFHMRINLYQTSRNIQPWPKDLYFMVHLLWTLARLSWLTFLSKVES